MAGKKPQAIYQLRVTLLEIDPPIWRRIEVSEDTKLPRLHHPDDEMYERQVIDERPVPLPVVAARVGDTFQYAYDFGDDWQHEVTLEAILLPEADAVYPRCIAGARNGPPEDVGGIHGYADYLAALADPRNPDHDSMLRWRGPFDPEEFSADRVNAALRKEFARMPKPAGRAAKPRAKRALTHRERLIALSALLNEGQGKKKRIPPGSTVPLELTGRERELIIDHSFAEDDLTARLRVVPQPGKPLKVRYSLDELDDLHGYIAAEGNHETNRKRQKEWYAISGKIQALLESYTDEP